MQAYKNPIDLEKCTLLTQVIDFYIYKKKCETFCHTATLVIHALSYSSFISVCFTTRKNEVRV